MHEIKMNSRKILFGMAACTLAAGIYFRTYALHPMDEVKTPEALARRMVFHSMEEQLRKSVDEEFPGISPEARARLAEERARRVMEADKEQFEKAVKTAANALRQSIPAGQQARAGSPSGRHYLLEADPYYFYYQTRMILETGKISPQIKNGRFFHPLMRAPHGYWPPFILHPYVGAAWYQLLHLFRPGLDLMEALNFVPLVLLAFVVVVFFGLASLFGTGLPAILLGALALVLSPIFIQRSAFGWYDTDPYNYIFPGIILALFFRGTRDRKKVMISGLAGGLTTGLYSFFWNGWPFIFVLITICSMIGWVTEYWPWRRSADRKGSYARFLGAYAGSSLFFAVLFMTPAGFINVIREGWTVSQQFALSKSDLWPNIFLTVGEAQGISLKKMIYLIGNYVTVGLALFGYAANGLRAFRSKDKQDFQEWAILSVFTLPLIVMSLRTERFCVLLVLPLALFVMLGAENLTGILQQLFAALRPRFFAARRMRMVTPILVFLIALPLQVISAHVVAGGIQPIMNDAWFEVMQQLKEKTPPDAIVNSWWPPGYFISSLAARRTTADGGTQHLHETYWMARFFLSPDEREAAGLLRMLNTSGNDALEYLQSKGFDLPDAIDLIPSIVSQSRADAAQKLKDRMDPASLEHLLDLTHGKGDLPPTYVFLYNDLMEQNLAVSMLATWDFRKAREIHESASRARASRRGLAFLKRPSFAAYLQEVFSISNGLLKYTPEANLVKREGDVLLFANGLGVNLQDMTSYLSLPDKGVTGQPMSFFYMRNGELVEKQNSGEKVDASALLITKTGGFQSVMADPRLIRSMLFRLYYLRGEGLHFFKPFIEKQDSPTGTTLLVYELDREAWEKAA